MNFEWRDATPLDCLEFNRWSETDNFKEKLAKKGSKNLNKFLNANRYGGFGFIIRQFINYQEFTSDDYFAKVATIEENVVGVAVVYKHPNKNLLECMAIAVDPSLQGNGYGTAMIFDIVKCHEKLFGIKEKCEVTAYIDKHNIASQTAFKKVGFLKTNKVFDKFEGLCPLNDQYSFTPKEDIVLEDNSNTNNINNKDFSK